MHHGTELAVIVIVTLTLLVGVGTRLVSGRVHFPYTIAMLLLGIGAGLLLRGSAGSEYLSLSLLAHASHVTPDLIIFVFLPALIFESAYSIDLHVFKNNVGAIVLYALPVLLLACGLSAALMLGLLSGSYAWGLSAALVFGALISATDPVAVVAILRELGVSKRLGVLIEGESLLNDGTAIVVFTVVVALLTGQTAHFELLPTLGRFVWVVAGGIGVGLGLSFIVSLWIDRLFNDPLSEITLTLVLSYSAMVIAEAFLHVSGVMAVVTTGLWMGSVGRTKVSPEVSHFLHRFWETLGYIANTLIFFLVGFVVASEVTSITWLDLGLIVVAYLGVMVIRLGLVLLARPLAHRLSDGVSLKDSLVISWGGLRGAVSLALALIVASAPGVPSVLGRQMLLLTAGIVVLTIVINGSTMAPLLSVLGYDKPSLSDRVHSLTLKMLVLDRVKVELGEVAHSPDLATCRWSEVLDGLEGRREALRVQLAEAVSSLAEAPAAEQEAAVWRRVLGLEKQAYWEARAAGTLAGNSMRLLERQISRQLDRIKQGDFEPPTARFGSALSLSPLRRLLGGRRAAFERLLLLYDVSRAEAMAASEVLSGLAVLEGVPAALAERIGRTYEGYRAGAKERIEDLRVHLPEVASAIETRLARRIELNIERDSLDGLERSGLVEEADAHHERHGVEERMSLLGRAPTTVAIPETARLVAETPLFSGLSSDALEELAQVTEELVFSPGEELFHQGERGDALYVVARGAVSIVVRDGEGERVVDVLGGGDILGEMALLTGEVRTATARAKTSVTVGRLTRISFQQMMQRYPVLRGGVLSEFAWRRFDNVIRVSSQFQALTRAERRAWFDEARVVESEAAEHLSAPGFIFLVSGRAAVRASSGGGATAEVLVAPQLIRVEAARVIVTEGQVRWLALGDVPRIAVGRRPLPSRAPSPLSLSAAAGS